MMDSIWIIVPNQIGKTTFDILQYLKSQGCKYNSVIGWYTDNPLKMRLPPSYQFIELKKEEIFSKENTLLDSSIDYIRRRIEEEKPIQTSSEWFGEIKKRFHNLDCILISKNISDTVYGLRYFYYFSHRNNFFLWKTQKSYHITPKSSLLLTGTVVDFTNEFGVKLTKINRCVINNIVLAPVTEEEKFDFF